MLRLSGIASVNSMCSHGGGWNTMVVDVLALYVAAVAVMTASEKGFDFAALRRHGRRTCAASGCLDRVGVIPDVQNRQRVVCVSIQQKT